MSRIKFPNPEQLFQEAVAEDVRFDLAEYWTTVAELRSKGFSWRLMARWFEDRSLKIDYSALRRFYKNTPIMEIAGLAKQDRLDRIHDLICEFKHQIENEEAMNSLITEAGWDDIDTEIDEVSGIEFDPELGIKATFSFQISGSAYDRGATFIGINGSGVAVIDFAKGVCFENVEGERDYGEDDSEE